MKAPTPRRLWLLLVLLAAAACAGSPSRESTVLMGESEAAVTPAPAGSPPATPRGDSVSIPFRSPGPEGDSFRLVVETSGEQDVSVSSDARDRPPLIESHAIELEYTELPARGAGARSVYLMRLDALHDRLRRSPPPTEREIEVGRDRLRILSDKKEELDLRGAQPRGDLTPRQLLAKTFATVRHDATGEPITIQARGIPAARRFLGGLPVREVIAYSRLPRPEGEIAVGTQWRAERYPPNPAGGLGLRLGVEYTLAGVTELDGVPCAWILLEAEEKGEGVVSAAGFEFERVAATLQGEAWVELATSRVRRLVLRDDVRVSYTRGEPPAPRTRYRLRYQDRLRLEPRDPDQELDAWADGTDRFGQR